MGAGLGLGFAEVLGDGGVKETVPGCFLKLGVKGTVFLLLEKIFLPLGVEGTRNLGWLWPSESELSPN